MAYSDREALLEDCLKSLVFIIEQAISSGDWRVDGACDPDIALFRAYRLLGDTETEALNKWKDRETREN
jgi:hypothetical protein